MTRLNEKPTPSAVPVQTQRFVHPVHAWSFEACTRSPILDTPTIDLWLQRLAPTWPTLPDMTFGQASLRIALGEKWIISFQAFDCFWHQKETESESTFPLFHETEQERKKFDYVAVAETWSQGKDSSRLSCVKPYDWTFDPRTYCGSWHASIDTNQDPFQPFTKGLVQLSWQSISSFDDQLLRIPNDPILFYSDVLLYEDEMSDHGICHYRVKVRVMPHVFLVLARYFCRIDRVCYRIKEVRIMAEASGRVQLMQTWKEATAEKVEEMARNQQVVDEQFLSHYLPTIRQCMMQSSWI